MESNLLVIVPCGKSKIWKDHPKIRNVEASRTYTGSPFKVNKAFAKKFADKWVILSAKYGFIEPSFIIKEDYNVTFNNSKTNPIKTTELKKQFKKMGLDKYDLVIALGGTNYTERVIEVVGKNAKVATPAAGLGLGYGLKYIKELTTLDEKEIIKKLF
jgi:hypothetical protein